MRKIQLLLLFLPLLGFSQNKKNVLSVERYFPKMAKAMEFEKALTAHVQKFHNGDWKWRVYAIELVPMQAVTRLWRGQIHGMNLIREEISV